MFDSILACIFETLANNPPPPNDSRTPESIASEIVTIILNADSPYSLAKQTKEVISINSWTDAIVEAILNGLKNAIKSGAQMARAAADALIQAKNAAIEFAVENPEYATLLALGVLALLTPWALEVFGFGELGPIEGSLAALWQSTYDGYVPKRALFGYFQKLGMKWHWKF
jgi:hypothetical protein